MQGYTNQPPDELCQCGHPFSQHAPQFGHDPECIVVDCPCAGYVPKEES